LRASARARVFIFILLPFSAFLSFDLKGKISLYNERLMVKPREIDGQTKRD